jgi:hypothetical protein
VSQELAIAADLFPHPRETMAPADRVERLYDQTHQRLFRLGCRMTGDADAALDLVQETFLRAACRPPQVSSFRIRKGETVVVGSSGLAGGKSLIVVLTALP